MPFPNIVSFREIALTALIVTLMIASAGVRSHVTLEGRLAVAGVCCGVSSGRLSDVKKLITLLVIHCPSPSVALFKSIPPVTLCYISLIALLRGTRYPLPQFSI